MGGLVRLACAAAVAVMTLAPASGQTAEKDKSDLPDGEGKNLTLDVCGGCHPVAMVTRHGRSKGEWQNAIAAMIRKGADASDEEFQTIIEYLAKHFGPSTGGATEKLNVNKADAAKLASFFEISAADGETLVRYRESNGPFKEWKDLNKAPRIDGAKIEAKKDRLEF